MLKSQLLRGHYMSAIGSRHSEQRVWLLASVGAWKVARAAPELVFREVKVVFSSGVSTGKRNSLNSLALDQPVE